MNGQEWGADKGLTIAETVPIAKIFEGAGVRCIGVSGYGFGPLPFRYLPDYWPYPEPEEHMKPYLKDFMGDGLLIPAAAAIKQAVNIPVIAVGHLELAAALDDEAVLLVGLLNLDGHVDEGFLEQAVADLAGLDVLAFAPGERRGILIGSFWSQKSGWRAFSGSGRYNLPGGRGETP